MFSTAMHFADSTFVLARVAQDVDRLLQVLDAVEVGVVEWDSLARLEENNK